MIFRSELETIMNGNACERAMSCMKIIQVVDDDMLHFFEEEAEHVVIGI